MAQPGAAVAAPPANDDFADAQPVGPALPVSVPATTVEATTESGEVHDDDDGSSVWFSWTAPGTGPVRVDVCDYLTLSGPGNHGLWVYTGNSIATLTEFGSAPNDCRVSFLAVEGTTYRIAFNSFFGGEGIFTLKMFTEDPPANDDFGSSQSIGPALPISINGSNVFATVEPGEPHHGSNDEISFKPHDSVWYQWTAQASTEVRIRACDGDVSRHLGVYTGGAVAALTKVTPTLPVTTFPFCSLRFGAMAGTTYRIAVSGFGEEEEGEFELDIHPFSPPPNDEFASAQPIGPALPLSVAGSNIDASVEEDEPDHSPFDDGSPYVSVWYWWTPLTSLTVRVSTCGTPFSSYFSVYTGPAVESLTKVGAGAGGCGSTGGHTLRFAASTGVKYLIAVGGSNIDEEGPFSLRIEDPLAAASANPPSPAAQPKPRFSLRRALKRCRKIKRKKPRRRCIRKARRTAKRLNPV
jgi:hypothetical protein